MLHVGAVGGSRLSVMDIAGVGSVTRARGGASDAVEAPGTARPPAVGAA